MWQSGHVVREGPRVLLRPLLGSRQVRLQTRPEAVRRPVLPGGTNVLQPRGRDLRSAGLGMHPGGAWSLRKGGANRQTVGA